MGDVPQDNERGLHLATLRHPAKFATDDPIVMKPSSAVAALVLVLPLARALRPSMRPAMARPRCRRPVALYEGDPWLTSSAAEPLSQASLDTLFRFGPVVYSARCFDRDEYNASVRKVMDRYPKISRELAEQEVNLYLFDATAFLAAQTEERKRSGPQESELEPPIGLADKVLVLVWVLILGTAVTYISSLIPAATRDLEATQMLLDAAPVFDQAPP